MALTVSSDMALRVGDARPRPRGLSSRFWGGASARPTPDHEHTGAGSVVRHTHRGMPPEPIKPADQHTNVTRSAQEPRGARSIKSATACSHPGEKPPTPPDPPRAPHLSLPTTHSRMAFHLPGGCNVVISSLAEPASRAPKGPTGTKGSDRPRGRRGGRHDGRDRPSCGSGGRHITSHSPDEGPCRRAEPRGGHPGQRDR